MKNLINTEITNKNVLGLVHIETMIKKNYRQDSENIKTPIETISENSLDKVTELFKPSDLVVIAARPANGKTSLSFNIAVEIALKQKLPVIFFSLEMSKEQMTQKIISSESRISGYQLRKEGIPKNLEENFKKAINILSNSHIYLDDSSCLTVPIIKEKLKKLSSEYEKIGAVVIDYLQLIEMENSNSITEKVDKVTQALKEIAIELNLPIILLSQLPATIEQRDDKRPKLSDFESMGNIVSIADLILFIYREEYYNPNTDKKNIAELIIAKNNNDSIGTMELYFDKNLVTFSDTNNLKII